MATVTSDQEILDQAFENLFMLAEKDAPQLKAKRLEQNIEKLTLYPANSKLPITPQRFQQPTEPGSGPKPISQEEYKRRNHQQLEQRKPARPKKAGKRVKLKIEFESYKRLLALASTEEDVASC
ncbi:unnamed protein product [Hermetia illucens]|uniref:Uncharacterized protein n=1 Tax=Hermetia illucens TaxID=343691 RepID=A0A7R8YNN5_HERIL|nr:unnamed protein product [Hermetia illucens]